MTELTNKKLLNLQEEYFMKKFINKIAHTAKSAVTRVKTAAANSMSAVLAFNRRPSAAMPVRATSTPPSRC